MDFENLHADVDRWLGKHFTKGRGGKRIDRVVIHYNAANLTIDDCYSVWQTRQASAHYQVEDGGRIGQLVHDWDTAWHAGNFDVNQRSIGIEHANRPDGTVSDACLDAGAHLVAALCKNYSLRRPEWGKNVFPHKRYCATACPGQLYGSQRDAYIRRAQEHYDAMTGGAPAPAPQPAPSPAPAPKPQWSCRDLGDTAWTGPAMVSEWQAQLGTTVDGCISGQSKYNSKTVQWAITVSPACNPARGSSMVIALQKRLIARGFGVGPDGADGHMGKGTVGALQAFLNDRLGVNIAVDGMYGHATSRAVGTALQRGLFR